MKQPTSTKHTLLLVIVLLILTNGATLWWQFTHHSSPQKLISEYPYIDPARNFIPQEDFIVNIQPLRETLKAKTAAFESEGGRVSLYLEFLNTGANISINQETYIYPASLTKVPIALVVMKKIEKGEWELTNELILTEADRDWGLGDREKQLAQYSTGTRFTIEKLLEALLVYSDNTAMRILFRNIDENEWQALVDELGLEELATGDGRYAAKEYARFLRSLYTASFLTRAHSERILEWLDQAAFNDFLSHAVPFDIPFPHKYGQGGEVEGKKFYADSGIVYVPGRPYLLVVLVEGEASDVFAERATTFMRDVSQEAYEYFSAYQK